jgi:hypothetical protein
MGGAFMSSSCTAGATNQTGNLGETRFWLGFGRLAAGQLRKSCLVDPSAATLRNRFAATAFLDVARVEDLCGFAEPLERDPLLNGIM